MSGGSYPQLASAMRAEKKYWGVSSTPADTGAFIQSLASHQSSTVRGTTFTVNATGTTKIYFACPSHFGAVTFSAGGFVGGFIKRSAVSVTDSLGVARSYDLYESVNAGLGLTTVTVTATPP